MLLEAFMIILSIFMSFYQHTIYLSHSFMPF